MKSFMYVAVRRDLSIAQQTVQSVHAAIEASKRYHLSPQAHPSVIVLGVKNQFQLNKFIEYAQSISLKVESFREPDRDNELTAAAVFPVSEAQKSLFSKFQLLK